tara:strand:+ start:1326 stop:2342 length:1017 start_codon:yes stop_codon:yes gene_type:complete
MFNQKSILITGGTGSFGKVFVEKLINNYSPKKIIIYSRDEMKQYEMFQQFENHKKKDCLRFFLGDIRDYNRLKIAFNDVDFVVHAAALKQVPAAEYNPTEFIRTNINGAENIIRASLENNVKKIIALSTDKAVNPINLYGATKLVSDKLFISANNYVGKKNIKFSVVRYGNVSGSRGSVIPYFLNFIKSKNYFPITDKNMTRFWITLDEGVKFVEQSFFRMIGGEIFLPKMPSIKITELAIAINPKKNNKIIGIRPGEKIHESMTSIDESHQVIEFKDHYTIIPSFKNSDELKKSYLKNKKGEKGRFIGKNFCYNSKENTFLSIKEIKEQIKKIGYKI